MDKVTANKMDGFYAFSYSRREIEEKTKKEGYIFFPILNLSIGSAFCKSFQSMNIVDLFHKGGHVVQGSREGGGL